VKCLIIEDEKNAAERIVRLVKKYDPGIEVSAPIYSVQQAVDYFMNNNMPDLILMDIQLSDGLSFEIFEKYPLKVPVIFTTAFNEYALKAFKVNSIDYLLKPIDYKELCSAIDKFKEYKTPKINDTVVFDSILKTLTNSYKSKFVVKVGEHIKVYTTNEIELFYSMEKAVFLRNTNGRDYALNYSLDQLEELLDPKQFFRISRQTIVSFNAIKDIVSYSSSRLKIIPHSPFEEELIVSRDRVQQFKLWLEG